jgi:PD-(D/E)XK nuclease superfamily
VGRMDFIRLDRAEWQGTRVAVIDFKTGGDLSLTAARMGREGASLQLGIYLAAALSLGATAGVVWMVKPGEGEVASMAAEELATGLALISRLEKFFATGIYGALTPDRSEYAAGGYSWPVACVPVPEAVLRAKFALTFGPEADASAQAGGDDA